MIDRFKSSSGCCLEKGLEGAKVEAARAVEVYSRSPGKTWQLFKLRDVTRQMERNRFVDRFSRFEKYFRDRTYMYENYIEK